MGILVLALAALTPPEKGTRVTLRLDPPPRQVGVGSQVGAGVFGGAFTPTSNAKTVGTIGFWGRYTFVHVLGVRWVQAVTAGDVQIERRGGLPGTRDTLVVYGALNLDLTYRTVYGIEASVFAGPAYWYGTRFVGARLRAAYMAGVHLSIPLSGPQEMGAYIAIDALGGITGPFGGVSAQDAGAPGGRTSRFGASYFFGVGLSARM